MARAAVAAATVSLAVGIAAAPQRADACSFIPMSRVFSPAPGEVHPASAGMLMMLSAELDELFSVTVDGAPASLVVQQELLLGSFYYDIVAIEPAPMPGQTVVLSQCGTEGSLEHARCPPGSPFTPILDFTIGPDDVTPPSADGMVALSHVIEHVDDPCSGSWEVRFVVSLTGFEQTDEPDVLYRVELRDSSGEIVGVDTRHVDEPAEAIDIPITFETVPADAVDHCVSVTAFDLSGNETLLGDVCGSNGPAPETGDTDGTSTTGSDDTTGADPSTDDGPAPGDSTDGAPIDPDATTTEDPSAADLEDRGCACAASSRPAPPSFFVWSMLLLVVRRAPSAASVRALGSARGRRRETIASTVALEVTSSGVRSVAGEEVVDRRRREGPVEPRFERVRIALGSDVRRRSRGYRDAARLENEADGIAQAEGEAEIARFITGARERLRKLLGEIVRGGLRIPLAEPECEPGLRKLAVVPAGSHPRRDSTAA